MVLRKQVLGIWWGGSNRQGAGTEMFGMGGWHGGVALRAGGWYWGLVLRDSKGHGAGTAAFGMGGWH